MIDLLDVIRDWSNRDLSIYLARVIQTWGSAPRSPGSCMLINEAGELAGSVSGGCVEGEVVRNCLNLFPTRGAGVMDFGVTDEDAWSVGLSCGGNIQVFVQPLDLTDDLWKTLVSRMEGNEPSILITSLDEDENSNSLLVPDSPPIGDPVDESLITLAWASYNERQHRKTEHKGRNYFIQLFPRKPRLVIIGVAHITVDLVTLGKMYGFETIVIDPRGYFAEKTTFDTKPDQLYQTYPSEILTDMPLDAYTFCAILSHDPKIDDNALELLLPSDVAYIGALGSRKTHAKRISRLLERGISNDRIQRIHAPVGLPIGASSAREIALSVMSEIIQVKNQFS